MPATSALTADGLPRIVADAALAMGWATPAAHQRTPDCAYSRPGRPTGKATDMAAETPALAALHTYWVAG